MSVLPAPTAPRLPANAFRVGAKRKLDISAGAPHLSLPPYELAGAASATPFSVHSPQPEIRIDCVAPRVQSPCAAPAGLSWEPLSLDVEKIAVKEGKSCRVAVQGPSAMLPGTRIPRLRVHPSLGPPTASVDPPLKPFWQKAWPLPRPVRWAALPLVLLAVFMVVRPGSGPAAQRPARAAVVPTPASISNWEAFRSTIADRASIRLVEDFRSGLADWEGSGNWAKTWSYDAAGFVRPGQLAIYNPSRNMKDYAFEFSAAIDQGGVGWVCRASDPKNFYAARLVISDPGPMQRLALIRYPVVKGKAGTRQRIVLPFLMRTRSMQHVRMEVRGSSFTVYVDGQLVEHWTHDQLQSGGIGFFGDSGDQFRLRWASVTHQYDLLGRLCALLAPSPGDFDSRSD